MWANGLSIGLLMRHAPYGIGLRHMVPAVFFLAFVFGLIILWVPYGWIFTAFLLVLHLAAGSIAALSAGRRFGMRYCWILPVVFLLNHLAYGAGTVVGMIRYFVFHRNNAKR